MNELFKFKHDNYSTIIYQDHSNLGSELPFRKKNRLVSKIIGTKITEQDFVDNYGNPLSEVHHNYQLVVITSDENKVSLKLFSGSRYRRSFTNYFRKSTLCQFITMSKKTGDLYTGRLVNYHKKRKVKKTFSKNNFSNDDFLSIYSCLKSNSNPPEIISKNQELYQQMIYVFFKELNIDYVDTPNFNTNVQLLKYYAKKKGIKYPDNIWYFIREKDNSLKLKEIRKFKGKFIDAFMEKNRLSGRVIKKALHNCENVNLRILKIVSGLFGQDWVNQDYELLLYCLNSKLYYSDMFETRIRNIDFLTQSEKRRAFNFLREYVLKTYMFGVSTFMDHLRMIMELKLLGENDITWRATNIHEFNEEHSKLASKLEYHKKGFYVRIYPKNFTDLIEMPIVTEDDLFYPILIKDTDEYISESTVQSNCVKTYIGNPSSYIVSLRRDDKNSNDRATIEFYITKFGTDVPYFRVKQALGKYNQSLSQIWEPPIQKLLLRFAKSLGKDNFEPVKIEKKFQNGKKLCSDTYWDEEGYLKWSSVDITSYYE
jgi:hypothetical protein